MISEIALTLSIISILTLILTIWMVAVKIKSFYINLWNMSKGLDILWENQQKIIELTKIKGFVQLTNEEEQHVREEIKKERTKIGVKKEQKSIRPSELDPNNQTT